MTEPPDRADPRGNTDPIDERDAGTDPIAGARATKVVDDSDGAVFDQIQQMLHHAKRVAAERGAEPAPEAVEVKARGGLIATEKEDAARAELSARVPAGGEHKTFEVAKVKAAGLGKEPPALAKPTDSRPLAIDPHLAAGVRLAPSDPDEARARLAKTDVVRKPGTRPAGGASAARIEPAGVATALSRGEDDVPDTSRPAGVPQRRYGWTVAVAVVAVVLITAVAVLATRGAPSTETAGSAHLPTTAPPATEDDEALEDDGEGLPTSVSASPPPSVEQVVPPRPTPNLRPPPPPVSVAPPTPSAPSAAPSEKGLVVPPRD